MRVVHFLHRIRLEDGGVVRATLDLCAALAGHGHEVALVTSDATDVPEAWKRGDVGCPKVEEVPPLTGHLKLLSRWSRRAIELMLSKADLVHIHEFWQPAAAQVAMIAKRLGTPYVISAHGMLDDWSMGQSALKKQVFLKLVGNRMFRGAGAVHCTAESEAEQASRWVPDAATGVVPYVLDLTSYRVLPDREASRAGLPGDPELPTVVFMSRLHHKKGLEHLIEATAHLARAGRPVELMVAGTGEPTYEESLRQEAAALGVSERVHFLGHVGGAAKVALLRAADMLVLPSYQENFGLVLVEALACGTPVVTTKAVDIWRELQVSGGSTIIDEPDTSAVVAAIARLVADPRRRATMGRVGREWVLNHLDPARVVGEFDRLYQRLKAVAPRQATPALAAV